MTGAVRKSLNWLSSIDGPEMKLLVLLVVKSIDGPESNACWVLLSIDGPERR